MRNLESCARKIARTALLLSLPICAARLAAGELPEGLSRFNPAGLAKNWQYEGNAFRALRATVPSLGTVPILRLHHPKRGYLLTSSESEASSAEKQGFAREGVAFYAPSNSPAPVLRFH